MNVNYAQLLCSRSAQTAMAGGLERAPAIAVGTRPNCKATYNLYKYITSISFGRPVAAPTIWVSPDVASASARMDSERAQPRMAVPQGRRGHGKREERFLTFASRPPRRSEAGRKIGLLRSK